MASDPSLGPDPRIGTVLRGKYRLDSVIGTGGMAVVYKATHRNHAEFAVKMLHPELSVVDDIRSRFVREGYVANAVKHPGAVLVVDDDVAEDGAAFLVMELLAGLPGDKLWGSLGKSVSARVASAIAIQVLDVLAVAHEKGIVHRDIKPANLFLTREGVVKVLDFGIARAKEAIVGAHATGSGMTLGTPAFMAPEHARGRAREIDARTDVWAVGATFFAMVTGELVHAAETSNEVLIAAATRPARSLAAVAPEIDSRLVEVIDRSLAFEKEERWASARAMREALEEAHRATFGEDDAKEVVAAAVKAYVPPPEIVRPYVSKGAETRTSNPESGRVRTERLSTSAAIARDRESIRARPMSWALVAGAVGVAVLCLGVWLKVRPLRSRAADAGSLATLATSGSDGAIVTARSAEAPPPAAPIPMEAPAAIAAPAPPAASAVLPIASLPHHHAAPPFPTRHSPALDAGAPAVSCNPPWFLDSAGHKQYKPECF